MIEALDFRGLVPAVLMLGAKQPEAEPEVEPVKRGPGRPRKDAAGD